MRNKIVIEHFDLHIDRDSFQFKIVPIQNATNQFAFGKKFRKLYVVRNAQNYLYVGEANTDIKTRLGRGFASFRYFIKTGKARGGYKGYKWIEQQFRRHCTLSVITFKDDLEEFREFVEAIEGELVFLIRGHTGKWPLFQNEIHFSNQLGTRLLSQKLFRELNKPLKRNTLAAKAG